MSILSRYFLYYIKQIFIARSCVIFAYYLMQRLYFLQGPQYSRGIFREGREVCARPPQNPGSLLHLA